MTEENKKCEGGMCGCGKCGMCGHMGMCKCRIMKKFFMLILMIVIFCFGIQLGELRTLSREMHSRAMMMQNDNSGYGMPQ